MNTRFVPALLVVLLFLPSLASARNSFNAQNLKPAVENGFYLAVYGSQSRDCCRLNTGAYFDLVGHTLKMTDAAGLTPVQSVIKHELSAHFFASYGFLPWFDAGLTVSAAPYQNFQPLGVAAGLKGIRMGDIRLMTRLRLLNNKLFPVGVGLIPFVTLPTGSDARFVGEGSVTGGGLVAVESKRFKDRFSLALNFGYEVRPRTTLSVQGTPTLAVLNDLALFGGAVNYRLLKNLELIGEMRGFTLAENFLDDGSRSLEAEGAIRYHIGPEWAVTAGGGRGIWRGLGDPSFRALVSFSYHPSKKLSERQRAYAEEMAAMVDLCPVRESEFASSRHDPRCPEYYSLREAVVSLEQILAEERIVTLRPDQMDQLEEQLVTLRTDQLVEKFATVILRQCRTVPARRQVVEEEGLPAVYFGFNKAALDRGSKEILAGFVRFLERHPGIRGVEVAGHADGIGTHRHNDRLSRRRAEAVIRYLKGLGIPPTVRLMPVGRGKREAVESNALPEGRAKNRRVIFRMIDGR